MAGIKKTEVWGQCPYRYVGNINEGGRRFKAYLCKKMWNVCSPTYCLGPDVDRDDVEVAHEEVNAGWKGGTE